MRLPRVRSAGLGWTLWLLLFLFTPLVPVHGQQAPQTKSPPTTVDTRRDDILILVNLTARELKFDVVPEPKVEFPGKPERTTVWVTDRYNLPDNVEPGVTYRNIGITLRISSRFTDIERIVREALGEVRVTSSNEGLPAKGPSTALPAEAGAVVDHKINPAVKRSQARARGRTKRTN